MEASCSSPTYDTYDLSLRNLMSREWGDDCIAQSFEDMALLEMLRRLSD
jgi:hypothetical protein